ncbi:MAG: hypothetical protein EOO75_15245, partial [Myxococcales bacterium]
MSGLTRLLAQALLVLGVALLWPSRARAQGDTLDAHQGHPRRVPGYTPMTALDALPWGTGSDAAAPGTILLAYHHQGLGVVMAEWDLAAGKPTRIRPVAGLGTARDVRLERWGDGVAVIASHPDGGPVQVVELSSKLRPRRTITVG